MFSKLSTNMSPKAIKAVKVSAVVVGIVAGALVTGYILYRLGVIPSGEIVEELGETAQAVL